MPLIVSILPSDLARVRGGGERYAFELHAALCERLADWSSLGLVAASDRASELLPEGWRAVGGALAGRLPSGDAIGARVALTEVPASTGILICHQWRTRAAAALRLRHGLGRKGCLVGIDYGGGSVAGYRLNRLPLPPADLGAHISELEATVSPVRAHRHQVIRGGIDPARFRLPELEQRCYDFLMVGRFLPHKGQELLLDSLPEGARALLIGPSDTDDRAYMDRVTRRSAELNVTVHLDASDQELAAAYQRARYTVQVPVVTVARRGATPPELLGLTMVEAMACGSVPICPATGASAEFVRDGLTGLTYEAGSPAGLERVLTKALDPQVSRAELQRQAVAEAARWTWAGAAEELLAALGGVDYPARAASSLSPGAIGG